MTSSETANPVATGENPASLPLAGLRIIEIASLGPAPFAAMVLADLGATIIRIERPAEGGAELSLPGDITLRGRHEVRRSDLRSESGRREVLELARDCDVLLEGFRPGAMERLGLGPADLAAVNPRLVYGRMTGWGQEGPLASTAGHDINYLSATGLLSLLGSPDRPPTPPLNLVADYGGGAMFLCTGVLAAVWNAARTGQGRVVDAAMVDGTSVLGALAHTMHNAGGLHPERGANLLDGGAPFYRSYRTSDGGYMALGALEQRFYEEFCRLAGLAPVSQRDRFDPTTWPALARELEDLFATRTRAEWTERFAGTDACCTPVVTLAEAASHPQLEFRKTLHVSGTGTQPAPAPRFQYLAQ